MGKITKAEATRLANELIQKFGICGKIKSYDNISISFPKYYTKESLINEIYANGTENIWFPWERNAKFNSIEDSTILSICNPKGEIIISEKFHGTYSIQELLDYDITNLFNHCTGVSNEMTINAGQEKANDYTIQYSGTSIDGENFLATVTYNTDDFGKKNYEISKSVAQNNKKTFKTLEKIYSNGEHWASQNLVQTQKASYKNKIYTIDQVESKIVSTNGKEKYITTETISDSNCRTLGNTSFEYDNQNYSGNPLRVASEDVFTDSAYVEEFGKIKTAKGNMTLKCLYNNKGEIVIEKPMLSNAILGAKKIDNEVNYIGSISVQNSSVKNLSQVVITPNEEAIKNPQDFIKVTEKLKTIVSAENNEIIVCNKNKKDSNQLAEYLTAEEYISSIKNK